MKIILLLISSFPSFLSAQSIPGPLEKYSYLIYLGDNRISDFATGFFIKRHGSIFFLTAGHAAGLNLDKQDHFPDNLNIVLSKPYNSAQNTVSLDISKEPRMKRDIMLYQKPDLYIYKFKTKIKQKINFVNLSVTDYSKFDFSKIEKVVLWGYPKGPNSTAEINKPFDTVYAAGPIIGSYSRVHFISNLNVIDSLTYWVNTTGTLSAEGDSGSPVFFKIGKKYFFGGVCVEGAKVLNVMTVIRPEIVLQKVDTVQ